MFGHDPLFFDLYESQADAAVRSARQLALIGSDFNNAVQHASRANEIEKEADEYTHKLANLVDARFMTPFDKDDMRRLAILLDDITDHIEASIARVTLYNIPGVIPEYSEIAALTVATTDATLVAVKTLRNLKNVEENRNLLIRVHELENQSDVIYRNALGRLFNDGTFSALEIMKWKEVLDKVELAIDTCEDVADILEGISVKYA